MPPVSVSGWWQSPFLPSSPSSPSFPTFRHLLPKLHYRPSVLTRLLSPSSFLPRLPSPHSFLPYSPFFPTFSPHLLHLPSFLPSFVPSFLHRRHNPSSPSSFRRQPSFIAFYPSLLTSFPSFLPPSLRNGDPKIYGDTAKIGEYQGLFSWKRENGRMVRGGRKNEGEEEQGGKKGEEIQVGHYTRRFSRL